MDFFASSHNTPQDGESDRQYPPHPGYARRSNSISFPHYCPQQQGYGYQSDPLLRRASQGLNESSLPAMPEEPTVHPGFSEGCQYDSATMKVRRSPPRTFAHRFGRYNTAPDLLEATLPSSTSSTVPPQTHKLELSRDHEDNHVNHNNNNINNNNNSQDGSQRNASYVSNPCLSHHVNARGYGSVQSPSQPSSTRSRGAMHRGHQKSYSHEGLVTAESSIPTPDDCVPHNNCVTNSDEKNDSEMCRIRNSQEILRNADATVSSKGRLFPTSQHVQHLHQYLRKLHKDVTDNAARLMSRVGSPPSSSDHTTETTASPQSSSPLLSVDSLSPPDHIIRAPSPLTEQALAKGGMNDLPDTTQDVYAALASPAESYTLQRRISQYGYQDPTLLAKLSLKEGEPDRCVRVDTDDILCEPYPQYRDEEDDAYFAPQQDSGSRTSVSPFVEVAKSAVRDRLQQSSSVVGSPPFSPTLTTEQGGDHGRQASFSTPTDTSKRPSYSPLRRRSSFTGFSEGPGMELYPANNSL